MISKTGFLALLIFALVLLTLPSLAVDAGRAGLDLPLPNGCHAVGTRTIVLKDPRRSRELLITIWYPAAEPASEAAPYMDQKTADALAQEWKLQPDFQRQVRTHAGLMAAIANDGPFPVVLLEHGSSVVPAIYTVLAEGLASSGFVVVATNHPPDSLISPFPDGHELKFTPYWRADADRRTQGVSIGKFAEEVLLADVRFVLDQLPQMNSQDHFWRGHLFLATEEHAAGETRAREFMRQRIQYLLRGGDRGRSHELYRRRPGIKPVHARTEAGRRGL